MELSKHDEAKENVFKLDSLYSEYVFSTYFEPLIKYITDMETMENELNELKCDVKRYFELQNKYYKIIVCGYGEWNNNTDIEYKTLKEKLSKVGDGE